MDIRGGSRILGKGGGGGSDKYNVYSQLEEGMGGGRFFLHLRLFSMKFTGISNTHIHHAISGLLKPACPLHSSQCYGSYCSAIKFVTQSFCEFVTEACTWPAMHQLHVGL